jgi:hypothetical protein
MPIGHGGWAEGISKLLNGLVKNAIIQAIKWLEDTSKAGK